MAVSTQDKTNIDNRRLHARLFPSYARSFISECLAVNVQKFGRYYVNGALSRKPTSSYHVQLIRIIKASIDAFVT